MWGHSVTDFCYVTYNIAKIGDSLISLLVLLTSYKQEGFYSNLTSNGAMQPQIREEVTNEIVHAMQFKQVVHNLNQPEGS